MKILFWNIRGLGGTGRRRQLVELCQQQNPHFVCFQETIKDSFRPRELDSFARGYPFFLSWIPPRGHSRGLLVGASKDIVEVVEEEHGEFFQSLHIRNVEDGIAWVLINFYGPVQDDRKAFFLQELLDKIKRTQSPLLVGGNLI